MFPLVVKLKIMLLDTAASDITTKIRAISAGGSSTWRRGFLAGAISSRGTTSAKITPHAMARREGTAKAKRQPACWTRKPVRIAANAMPRLPASPLSPMVKPGRVEFCTIIGMPTG